MQPKDYNYDVAFEKQSLRSRKTKMHNQLACLVKMAINDSPKLSDYAIDHLRRIIFGRERESYMK